MKAFQIKEKQTQPVQESKHFESGQSDLFVADYLNDNDNDNAMIMIIK